MGSAWASHEKLSMVPTKSLMFKTLAAQLPPYAPFPPGSSLKIVVPDPMLSGFVQLDVTGEFVRLLFNDPSLNGKMQRYSSWHKEPSASHPSAKWTPFEYKPGKHPVLITLEP